MRLRDMAGESYVANITLPGPTIDTEWTWSAWTPAITASVNPNTGSGVRIGRFTQAGSLVMANFTISFVDPGASAGSGSYLITLPVPANPNINAGAGQCLGFGWLYDGNPVLLRTCLYRLNTSTNMVCYYQGTPSFQLGSTTPHTWAAGDALTGHICYEAA
jgi:hypothetical protein